MGQESLEEISGKERYKTQVNERLIAERAQLDHQIAVLRQQLENAEIEKSEAVDKLKEQVLLLRIMTALYVSIC